MKNVGLFCMLSVAVFAVTLVLMTFTNWLFPKKPEPQNEMGVHNPDAIVGVQLLGHGCISIAIVFALVILFEFI